MKPQLRPKGAHCYVSSMRIKINGQPFLTIDDETTNKTWAMVPYSDRTDEDHRQSYEDARKIAAAFNVPD